MSTEPRRRGVLRRRRRRPRRPDDRDRAGQAVRRRQPVLGLPKGHPDGDETPEQAAAREVAEETGVTARLIELLGDVEYRYERKGRPVHKRVRFFLFEYERGDLADHDHEIEVAEWLPLRGRHAPHLRGRT